LNLAFSNNPSLWKNENEVNEIFNMIDKNESNAIDFSEFLTASVNL